MAGGAVRGIIDYGTFGWFITGYIFSFASVGIGIISIVSYKRFVGIRDVKANAMEKFDYGEDFKITFFAWMHGRGIDDGMSIFDVVDFVRRERRVDNILSEIEQSVIVVFLYGDIGMDRETGMTP